MAGIGRVSTLLLLLVLALGVSFFAPLVAPFVWVPVLALVGWQLRAGRSTDWASDASAALLEDLDGQWLVRLTDGDASLDGVLVIGRDQLTIHTPERAWAFARADIRLDLDDRRPDRVGLLTVNGKSLALRAIRHPQASGAESPVDFARRLRAWRDALPSPIGR